MATDATTNHSAGAPETEAPAGPALTHREVMFVIGGLMLALLLAALDQTIVATALPTIVGDLRGATNLSWVITAYLLTSTAVTPLYGKIGDLYGRKRIFLFAVGIFLVGSALCGAAQNMNQLIAFRAVQGLGAGGLFALSLAIVGDITSPRERGRYQGYFGAVFGLSSVAGPLIGGYLTENIDWRWVFYVNIPIGLIALAVISSVLKLPVRRSHHRVDYLGAALLTAAVSALLLVTVWGGGHPAETVATPQGSVERPFTGYAWSSPVILGLLLGGLVLVGLFLAQERRHDEPILPLPLFGNRVFSVSVALSFVSGVALFGTVVFVPQFQQIVKGFSPTESGLLMIPLTIGIVFGAVGSGRLITKLGHYRVFPIVGTALLTLGFILLSGISVDTSETRLGIWMLVIGVGIGLFMQVVVLAVQNSVEFRHMGAGTSAVTFFRTLGGAFGTAVFGAILNNQVADNLPRFLNGAPAPDLDTIQPNVVAGFTPLVQNAVYESFARGLHVVFLWAIPAAVIAFALALALPDQPLRTVTGDDGADGPRPPAFE